MSIILKGEVAVLSASRGGDGTLDRVATLTVSDAFGAQSLIDGQPRGVSAVCLVECELAVLTRRDYLEAMMHRHEEEADREVREAMEGADAEEDGDEPLSLLDPAFFPAAALPAAFQLTPHLQNYIDILSKQTSRAMEEESRRPSPSPTALGPSSRDSSAFLMATATALASPGATPPSPDTIFLLNLLKTCKPLQLHDRRPVLLALTRHLTLHHYPPDTVLYEAGSPATHTLFVLSGSVAEMATNSYSWRHRARAERKAKRHSVRTMVARWEETDRREAEEARRRKEIRPGYMARTAQTENALRENAGLIDKVQLSVAAQEKQAERDERARLAQEARQAQVDALMLEYQIDTLESSEDEEETANRRRMKQAAAMHPDDPAAAAAAGAAQPPPHQFPLGSCRSVRLYPEHVGWTDIDAHLSALQEERLALHVSSSVEFSARERERGAIISAAIKKGQSLGTGLQAAHAANLVLEEARIERERVAAQQEAARLAIQAERNSRMKHGRRRVVSSEIRTIQSAPQHAAASSTLSSTPNAVTPVYLDPSFASVVYSRTVVTRESVWIARLPNSLLLTACEAPYHGAGVTERLNDPVLRYTVLRPQDPNKQPTESDPDDPDAHLEQKAAASAALAAATSTTNGSGVRLDYSHHIEGLFTAMQHLKFFSIQNRELGLKLCASMRYLRLNKGDILCHQGRLGSLFYILMSGSISIHIKPQFVVPQLAQALIAAEARSRKGRKKKKDSISKGADKNMDDESSSSPAQPQGSAMIQSLMFPSSSPIELLKRQEREQKEGEAAAAAVAATATPTKPTRKLAERQGSIMIQSLMFPSTSPVKQMKLQERDQKEGEAAAAASVSSPTNKSSTLSRKIGERQGSVIVQSLMFPSTSPVEQMKQQEREQQEGEAAAAAGLGSAVVVRKADLLDAFTPPLSKLIDPPSLIARHLDQPYSSIDGLTQLDALYGPCVKVAVSGDPIGESAIVSSNPRSATCICREPVELFTLSKEDYRAIYAVPQHLKVNTIINLVTKKPDPLPGVTVSPDDAPSLSTADIIMLEHCIRDIEWMKPLHVSIRSILGQRLHHLQVEAGRVVFEQGSRGHYLYIILSNSCSVYMKPPTAAPALIAPTPLSPTAQMVGTEAEPRSPAHAMRRGSMARLREESTSIDADPSELSREPSPDSAALDDADLSQVGQAQPQQHASLHRRSHRTVSGVRRTVAALAESTARPGAEMLSSTGPKAFKFSAGATVSSAAGGGRAFSAGRIRPSQLVANPPVTNINLSEQDSAYLANLGSVTSILSVGSSFGEAALQAHGPGVQTATVVTNGPTDLLLLTRSSYAFALESLQQWKADLEEVHQWLKTSHFFAGWSPTTISKAMNLMERREIKRGEVIIKQGEPAKHIFFLLKGEIHATQAMQLVDAEIPTTLHPAAATLERVSASNAALVASSSPKRKRAVNGFAETIELPFFQPHRAKGPVTIQSILKEQRIDEEAAVAASIKPKPGERPVHVAPASPAAFPIRAANGLVGSLLRPQYGLPLLVPTLTAEEPVPLVGNANHMTNFSGLVAASQMVDGLNPATPIVDGGQIWLHWPQRPGCPYSTVSSGVKRRGAKRIYKSTTNNGTEVQLNKKGANASGVVLPPANTSAAPASAAAPGAMGESNVSSSPVFPFTLELASLSHNGVCGNLETLLPTVLGVRELLGRPESEEEISRERERREREAYAIEHGELLPPSAPSSVPSTSQQCQLAYPSTFTAFTDCTLVAFPSNAFHTLLSLSEEMAFLAVHRDRLAKNCEKVRRWLEGRFLASPPFTRALLEDFRIFEENMWFSSHRYTPEESVHRDKLNALLRPGVKPPALVDYRSEEQLRELKEAGLANHPYVVGLEAHVMKTKLAADKVMPAPSSSASFSQIGTITDQKYSMLNQPYVGHAPPRPQQARQMLDTICAVSQANASLPNMPATVAAEFGHSAFDPMRDRLPSATASHTPEFKSALKYAEHHAAQRRLHRSDGTTSPGMERSQSVPVLPPGGYQSPPFAAASQPATPQQGTYAPNPDSPSSRLSLHVGAEAEALTTPPLTPTGDTFCLSPLSHSSHASKFLSSRNPASRNPAAAATMVQSLLANDPHELEQFLVQLKSSSSTTSGPDSPPKRGKKKAHSSTAQAHEAEEGATAAGVGSSPLSGPTNVAPATTGSQYALTSAVLALQSKSSLATLQQSAQMQAQAQAHAARASQDARDQRHDAVRAQSRAIAKALCLPDPYSSDVNAQATASHIRHLQKVVRGEASDGRGSFSGQSAAEEKQAVSPAFSAFSLSSPLRRGLDESDWPSLNSPHSTMSPSRSVSAYTRTHQRLQVGSAGSSLSSSVSSPMLAGAGSFSFGASPASATSQHPITGLLRSGGSSSALALQLLHTSLSSQESALVSGGALSTESLHRSQLERLQTALREEEEIARQLGVPADIVHSHAGHAAIHQAQKRQQGVRAPSNHRTASPARSSIDSPAMQGGFRVPHQRSSPSPTHGASASRTLVSPTSSASSATLPKLI